MRLNEGDTIALGVTHQIRIDGMDSWVRADVNSTVGDTETTDEAWLRVSKVLTSRIIDEVERQATVVMEANKKHTSRAT